MPPVVGICAVAESAKWSFWSQDAALVADTYVRAVRTAGGLPVVLVPQTLDDTAAQMLLDRIDGLLLIGGADISPGAYGQDPSGRTEATYPVRDQFEQALVLESFNRDLPVLGICRGLHVLNVATGGTLHQHLPDEGFAEHRPAPGSLDETTMHEVEIKPGTALAEAVGEVRERVNSHHHQGIARIGHGGRPIAHAVPDGLVEAIDWPEHRYTLGVQWHPEAMELSTTLAGFVGAATETSNQKVAGVR